MKDTELKKSICLTAGRLGFGGQVDSWGRLVLQINYGSC
jgi:hypothetical protein